MPIGPYESFAECVADQKTKGHDRESAEKICGAMEAQKKSSADLGNRERRYTSHPECRVRNGDGKRISGYAAVFYNPEDRGTEYQLPEFDREVVERISPRAFDSALKRQDDVRALYNHNPDHVLGRSTAGTLSLTVDERGLRYDIELPDTQLGRDLRSSIERGDISGSSFAFIATDVAWEEKEDAVIREIRDVQLFDVGPVTYPAYESTVVAARCSQAAMAEYEAWRAEKRKQTDESASRTARAKANYNRVRAIEAGG